MEMEICETGVLKLIKWLVRPLVTVPAPYTHKQHQPCFYIICRIAWVHDLSKYVLCLSWEGGKHAWIVRYLLKEKKTYARISSAVLQSWRELSLKQSHTALFEKDLELLVIANVTVFSQTEPSFSLSTRTMHVIPAWQQQRRVSV